MHPGKYSGLCSSFFINMYILYFNYDESQRLLYLSNSYSLSILYYLALF